MWKQKLEAVNFLWKRKHFDERDWKRKRTRKRLILSQAGSGSKKIPKVRKRKRTRKHKTSRGAGSIGGLGTLQKYRGTGTRYFAKISTAVLVPVLSN